MAVDAAGNVYVADYDNHRIQKFDSDGNFITKWGEQGSGDGQFYNPARVAIDTSGNVYVADRGNFRIQKFDSDGNFITKWGSFGSGDGQLWNPFGVAVDSSGNVYVADQGNHRIQKFDGVGTYITKWGSEGSGDGQFFWPTGVAVDASGNVYVSDGGNNRIQKFDSSGNFITKWGSNGTGDGQFKSLNGVAIDALGNVYTADSGSYCIQKFDSDGNFITKWGSSGSGDGQFDSPTGVAVDASGNVYVSDYGNNRIQDFTPERQPTVATVAATDVAATSAILNGDLTWLGAAANVGGSFEYGLDTNYGSTSAEAQVLISTGPFSKKIDSLLPETTYHYRAKAQGEGISYGEDMTFTTSTLQLPVVSSDAAEGTITLSGTLNSLGSALAVDVYFEYGTTTSYGSSIAAAPTMTSTGAFNGTIDNLIPQTIYHFRAKAVGDGTVYGEDATFGTSAATVPGDANGDGEVNALDITKTERLVAGLD
ncbi:6-bladed beta-propeller [Chloroflexota bacterium]